jgi:hypothetical protein
MCVVPLAPAVIIIIGATFQPNAWISFMRGWYLAIFSIDSISWESVISIGKFNELYLKGWIYAGRWISKIGGALYT